MRSQEDHICSDKQVDNINKYTTKLQGQYMLVVDRLLATMAESNLMMA